MSDVEVVYNPTFEPGSVAGQAAAAVGRSFDTWDDEVEGDIVLGSLDANASLAPTEDRVNVIGWRQLVGRDAKRVLAATYIWDDGAGTILEADILYNLGQDWAVNTMLDPTTCGTDFDVQGIGTHEIGHFYGLGHTASGSDATMAPSAAKGELEKQTLAPGDQAGIAAVAP